jgi:putative hydrolase
MLAQMKRAVEELRAGADVEGPGGILLLLTPEQREIFERTQGMMSLLEGHASFVMNEVADGHVGDLDRLKRALASRRKVSGLEQQVQKLIGFDHKIQQYLAGEVFVREVIERSSQETFNLVWRSPEMLPTNAEIAEPGRWLARVTG